MEMFTRGPLAALACALAGPVAAWGGAVLLAPVVLGQSIDLTPGADLVTQLGETLLGVIIGTLVMVVLMTFVGLVVTMAALVLTRCPHPAIALLACVVLTPLWAQVLDVLPLGFAAWLACLGLVPGAVRAAFGLLSAPADGRTGGGSGGRTLVA